LPAVALLDWTWVQKGALLSVGLLLCMLLTSIATKSIREGLQALDVGLQNFKDGEFSSSLAYSNKDELGELCALYNQTATQLRQEKHWLHQRELMLDKVLQSSPDVLLLVNVQDFIVFSNWAAREFFASKTRLEGNSLSELLDDLPIAVSQAIEAKRTGLLSVMFNEGESETWHIASGTFMLNNQQHTLFILKQMTRELSRQEVAVWKKVIRLISHELNNSLGPISSMLHSGKLISEKLNDSRLTRVFNTIEERITHLNQFVQGYGKFARLPAPNPEVIQWSKLLYALHDQWTFQHKMTDDITLQADPVQLEQLLINLLKNAHESGSASKHIAMHIYNASESVVIEIHDQGKGMPESVISNALIPFYSTKSTGSGLGLALCREIIDAHHGNIVLQNKDSGGLIVRISLPKVFSAS
jgi:nitrogen fixation/metabolism regulation signal transduction histidine kinase